MVLGFNENTSFDIKKIKWNMVIAEYMLTNLKCPTTRFSFKMTDH